MTYETPVLTLIGAAQGLILGSDVIKQRSDSPLPGSRSLPEL